MAGYIGLRFLLSSAYGMHTPSALADTSVLERNIIHTSYGFGSYTFLEGFWLLLPLLLLFAFKNRHYLVMLVVVGLTALSTITALCVYDITRSGSYVFPIIFVMLVYLSRFIEKRNIRIVLMACMFFSLIFPPVNYVAFADLNIWMEKPLPGVLYSIFFR